MKLPYETVMNMPLYIRKLWIVRHNRRCEEEKNALENQGGTHVEKKNDAGINEFARLEQQNQSRK